MDPRIERKCHEFSDDSRTLGTRVEEVCFGEVIAVCDCGMFLRCVVLSAVSVWASCLDG